MKYAIGPILYFWPKTEVEDFYRRAMACDADDIYLGETVCNKRQALKIKDYFGLAEAVAEAGKNVFLSSMSLVEAPSELKMMRRLCNNGEFVVEANDMAAVNIMRKLGLPFVAGPSLNIYNHQTLHLLAAQGMVRWCMPVELSRDRLAAIISQYQQEFGEPKFEIEVFSYGHMPLAISARCFTARSENRDKDHCELCCIKYPAGRQTQSQDGQSVFVLNGVQTMSGHKYNLQNDAESMQGLVDVVRISPEPNETFDKLAEFVGNVKKPKLTSMESNGYWHQIAGIHSVD